MNLKDTLGLHDGMSTYFLRAPAEYWQALGMRQAPYNDQESEYDFIHAFFTDTAELNNFADILVSKLAEGGILWVSWPSGNDSGITEESIEESLDAYGLTSNVSTKLLDQWLGIKFEWAKS